MGEQDENMIIMGEQNPFSHYVRFFFRCKNNEKLSSHFNGKVALKRQMLRPLVQCIKRPKKIISPTNRKISLKFFFLIKSEAFKKFA